MKRKYPHCLQTGLKDCGPACLQMILLYYDGYVGIDKLSLKMHTTRNGTTAYHFIETAQELGFDAKGIKTDISYLEEEILPCVAHVIIEKVFHHYIVIYQNDKKHKKLLIADPMKEIKWISYQQFEQIWDGVLLLLKPNKKLLKESKLSLMDYLIPILKPHRTLFLKIIVLSILLLFISILCSFSFTLILDTFKTNGILLIGLVFLFLIVIKNFFFYVRGKLLIYFHQQLERVLILDTFSSLLSLPFAYYTNHTTGEVTSRMDDVLTLPLLFSEIGIILLLELPLLIGIFFILFRLQSALASIFLLLFFLLLTISLCQKKKVLEKIDDYHVQKGSFSSYLVESISGFETIKGINIDKTIYQNFEQKCQNHLKSSFLLKRYVHRQASLKQVLMDSSQFIFIVLGCFFLQKEMMTLGVFLTFQALIGYFLEPMEELSSFMLHKEEIKNILKRVLELQYKRENNGKIKELDKYSIQIHNLNYSYNKKNKILSNIHLNVREGEKIMLIGESGSGKSTLLQILKNYYKVSNNQIFIGDYDINQYKIDAFENISYFSQNEFLFTGTLYENLKVCCDDDKQIEKICRICCIDEMITKKGTKMDLYIEENGFNLSAGERSRIALARVLLKNPKIVLLDETFSQMDISLERKILKNMIQEFPKTTFFVVSHRIDNWDLFYRVVELNQGKIIRNIKKEGR